MLQDITVPQNFKGRLDRFLRQYFPKLPQSLIEKSIRKKCVLVNRKKQKSNYCVIEGDIVSYHINFETFEETDESFKDPHLHNQFLDMIVYENEDLCVISKPYNVASQGGTNVKYSIDQMANAGNQTYFLVHRIDKKTTGLLVLAKNRLVANTLMHQFKNKLIQKYYIALTDIKPFPESGVINTPLYNTDAQTRYKYVRKIGPYYMLLLKPYTGRKHQIRLHLQDINSPIVGDETYGGIKEKRMFLHAYKIKIPDHPTITSIPDFL